MDFHADPPIIDTPDQLGGAVRFNLGNLTTILETESLEDGSVVGYIGVEYPTNIHANIDQQDFIQHGPIGAAIAVPIDDSNDTQYRVDLPDKDAVNDALRTRRRYENRHRSRRLLDLSELLRARKRALQEQLATEFPENDRGTDPVETDLPREDAIRLATLRSSLATVRLFLDEYRRLVNRPLKGDRRWGAAYLRSVRKDREHEPAQ